MTIYEMILEEGRQQGIILGREKLLWDVTLQMLLLGYDADSIQSLLQVDQKVIDQANSHLQRQHENRFWF
jgi:hypothetical protein